MLKYLEMPSEIIYRKAFPGPALAARIIGVVSEENLRFEKQVHDIVESSINDFYMEKYGKFMIINENGEQEPFQAFAAIGEDILNKKVTGVIDGMRKYEFPLSVDCIWNFGKLSQIAKNLQGYSRLLYRLENRKKGEYDVIIRSINSIDARSASVTHLPIDLLTRISRKLLELERTQNIFFDITPKPPGTIEYV